MRTPSLFDFFKQPGLTSVLAATFSILIGSLVLCGWHFDIPELKSILPTLAAMNPLTAIAFIWAGFGILSYRSPRPWLKILSRVFAFLIFSIGFLKILSFAGFDFTLDQVFFTEKLQSSPSGTPNRMAPNTALAFLLLGLSFVFLHLRVWISQVFSLLAMLISFLALVGYIYGVSPLTQVSYFIPMALNTAITFAICGLGLLGIHTDQGLVALITNKDAGGFLLRRVLPVLVLVPPIFGWLTITGEELHLFSSPYAVALMVISGVLMTTTLIFWNARSLGLASQQVQQLNSQLQSNLSKLADLNKELESFSYSVSHDLRAPLRSILGFSSVLLETDGEKLSEQGKNSFDRVITAAQRMEQLIEGLLDLARLTRGELKRGEFSMTAMAQQIAQQLKDSSPHRKVEFVIADGITSIGDERLLEVVLQNLMGNAWKFTSKNPLARIEVGKKAEEDQVSYYVKDNGAGFDMSYAERLFGAFQRLHKTEEFAGTGIGLATVKRIINRHGGTIWAEGKVNEGATFHFTLIENKPQEIAEAFHA